MTWGQTLKICPTILKKIEVGLPDLATDTAAPKASLQKDDGG